MDLLATPGETNLYFTLIYSVYSIPCEKRPIATFTANRKQLPMGGLTTVLLEAVEDCKNNLYEVFFSKSSIAYIAKAEGGQPLGITTPITTAQLL